MISLGLLALPLTGLALPARLVLALDGVAYQDLKALQAGIVGTNFWGKQFQLRAFTADEGYFPVSRMVSTFPSTSDVAWTDIFGDRPLPGYQRTYYSAAANSIVSLSSLAGSMEHESQMQWQLESGFLRGLGYLFPRRTFQLELHDFSRDFWQATGRQDAFYVYVRASDNAQHLGCDIIPLLCRLDRQLQDLRVRYRAREGHDLQIVILSDHGHNHAGRGQRVGLRSFLEKAGYRIAGSIGNARDVVLPTAGIECWAEIHNAPAETETLARRLCHLPGVDVLTARLPDQTNRFLVMDSNSARAFIDWHPANNSYRYATETGDPLNYRPVIEALARDHRLDADGFATADDWLAATMTNRYPLAPERIVRGLTQNTLNPATILLSLDDRHVNDNWWVHTGSRLVDCRSTHGGLDDICSDGIVLSNFQPTHDTSTMRVAAQFDDFPGLNNFREEGSGAEWLVRSEQAEVRIRRRPLDTNFARLPEGLVCLHVWSPEFLGLAGDVPLRATVEKANRVAGGGVRRGEVEPRPTGRNLVVFSATVLPPADRDCERVYALPAGLVLAPRTEYRISGRLPGGDDAAPLFVLDFRTDAGGQPLAF